METLEITIPATEEKSEILAARLGENGFEGFEISDKTLKAYIAPEHFNKETFESILENHIQNKDYTIKTLEDQNWNETWEKNFAPVVVDNKCRIRADFHEKSNHHLEVVITPKMAFGTGHHPTTRSMISWLLKNPVQNKSVIDAGCGAGVLSILAEKLGAKWVNAYDNNSWAYYNTLENIQLNNASRISVFQGEAGNTGFQEGTADIVLANINKNTLLTELPVYAKWLTSGGHLVLSGFYSTDSAEIAKKGAKLYLRKISESAYQGWTLLVLSK